MKEISLYRHKKVIVDDEDYELLNQYTWSVKSDTNTQTMYAKRTIPHPEGLKYKNGKTKRVTRLMHREIMNAPPGMQVDHINGDGLDNRRCNLRLCTIAENRRNQKLNKNNTVGFKGVSKTKSGYRARININRKEISLGCYPTAERAAKAYDKAAILYYGKFARLNFP